MTNWRFEVDVENIGWLTIDTPNAPVNTLSRAAISELETALLRVDDLVASGEVVGLVIQSGKDSGFIAGADVSEFDQMSDPAILHGLAASLGLDAARLAERANAPDTRVHYDSLTQEAIDRGVFGVPTYVLNGEMFWGQDRLDFLARALAQ